MHGRPVVSVGLIALVAAPLIWVDVDRLVAEPQPERDGQHDSELAAQPGHRAEQHAQRHGRQHHHRLSMPERGTPFSPQISWGPTGLLAITDARPEPIVAVIDKSASVVR